MLCTINQLNGRLLMDTQNAPNKVNYYTTYDASSVGMQWSQFFV